MKTPTVMMALICILPGQKSKRKKSVCKIHRLSQIKFPESKWSILGDIPWEQLNLFSDYNNAFLKSFINHHHLVLLRTAINQGNPLTTIKDEINFIFFYGQD